MLLCISILLGLCFGSFLNVLIIRTPMDKSVILPSSSCISCGKKLKFYHNIPIISYLFLRGKCAFCFSKISIMYPLVELAGALFGLFVYLKFGFSFESLFIGISILLFLALSIIDLKTKEVPDNINFGALVFGLIGGILHFDNFLYIVGSTFAMAGFFTLLRFAFQSIARKEALGEGDIIVVATMGALLGWKIALFAIFLSSLFALIILLILSQKNYKIPFVPFLFLGTLPCLFFDNFFNSILYNYMF